MVSFPTVGAMVVVVAVGNAWKNSTVEWVMFGFLMMTLAFWVVIWRVRTSEWKK